MIRRLLNYSELIVVLIIGKLLGIRYIIRYLKNPNPDLTVYILKSFSAKIGKKTSFKGSVIIENAFEDKNSTGDFSHLNIGNNCYLGEDVYLDLSNKISIHDNVVISGRVSILTHSDCNRSSYLDKRFPRKSAEVVIEDDVWIGFNAVVMSGIKIKSFSVIGANSLVSKEIESHTLSYGIPAKIINRIK